MVHPTITGLRAHFAASAATAPHPDASVRRRSVPNRKEVSDTGETMDRYINGLEARLKAHMGRHMPRWHHQEAKRILHRWNRPAHDHPAPIGAFRRDIVSQASDYAAALLHDRLTARLQRLDTIRLSLNLDTPSPLLRSGLKAKSTGFRENGNLKF